MKISHELMKLTAKNTRATVSIKAYGAEEEFSRELQKLTVKMSWATVSV